MVAVTKEELERKVYALERELSNMQGAVSKLGQADNNLITMLSKLSGEISAFKNDLRDLKVSLAKVNASVGVRPGAGISSY